MLIYLLEGYLPWKSRLLTPLTFDEILNLKLKYTISELQPDSNCTTSSIITIFLEYIIKIGKLILNSNKYQFP